METISNIHRGFKPLNLLDPSCRMDPYPFYEETRARNPIYWSDVANSWFLMNYSDVLQAAHDKRFSSARAGEFIKRLPENERPRFQTLKNCLSRWTLLMDPPEHTRHRALLSKAFIPRAIEGMASRILEVTTELLDDVMENGKMDVIQDFAYPLPVIVISEILGVPKGDREWMKHWSDGISGFVASPKVTPENADHAQSCLIELNDYFSKAIQERRRAPREDFLTYLIQAEEQGQVLDDDEVIAICSMLIFAGHETTTNLLGNGLLALLQNPEELKKLRSDLSLLPQAIEELLRYDSPVQMTSRVALQDIPIGEFTARAGERVFFLLGAANRDSARFDRPMRLDILRKDVRPLSFGHGIHFCPGAMLSKLEARVAFQQILERMPHLSRIPVPLDWRPDLSFRGLRTFPVRF